MHRTRGSTAFALVNLTKLNHLLSALTPIGRRQYQTHNCSAAWPVALPCMFQRVETKPSVAASSCVDAVGTLGILN
jgi:hypothetical protein